MHSARERTRGATLQRRMPVLLALWLFTGCSLEDRAAYSQTKEAASPAAGEPADNNAGKHPPNRLAQESSPYLLLHAHNPVDWYPWGPEAFEKARRENKPIFLSIGYSSCFWCHVMEREVFENAEIAAYMNEHFVNVKVDREERPDIDDIYMTALQIYFQAIGSTQGGGWPLSIFLTPEGKPIGGGTYFPPEDAPGRPGFPTVMATIRRVWSEQQEEIERSAEIIAAEVRRVLKPQENAEPVPLTRELVQQALAAVLQQYDSEFGGLDFNADSPDSPKFPVPSRLMLLQAQAGRPESEKALKAVDHTLQAMAAGGIYDHLAGGFHRYSTDRQWLVPHFEKMLYDNAQLAQVYSEAYRRTNRKQYRRIAAESFDFVLREMTHQAGGFHSALDAETDGVEGAYYVWSPGQIEEVLGAEDAAIFKTVYGLDQPEFFEHGYVLHLPQPIADAAGQLGLPEKELRMRLAEMRKRLLEARSRRKPLLKDDKLLTSWNGLMIRALAVGAKSLQSEEYLKAAEAAAVMIAAQVRGDDGRLLRTWRGGQAKLNAYLDDYAFLIAGYLALHQATGDEKWLHASRRLMDDQIAGYWDPQAGGFFFTSNQHEELLARTKDAYDSVLPSGNSVSVRNLVRLSILTGDERYQEYARRTLQVFAPALKRSPGSMPFMALALQEYIDTFGEERTATPAPAIASNPPVQPMPESPAREPQADDDKLVPLVVQPEDPTGQHKARAAVYLGAEKLAAGQSVPVAVVLEIEKGWHLNANPPRPDYVIPVEVKLSGDSKIALKDIQYPPGKDFRVAGFDEPLSVYEERVILRGALQTDAALAGKSVKLSLTVRYQACNDQTCSRPLTVTLDSNVAVAAADDRARRINAKLFPPQAE